MTYENHPVPDEVNVSKQQPISDFLRLSIGTILLVIGVVSIIFLFARFFAPLIPFEYEHKLASHISFLNSKKDTASTCQQKIEAKLKILADKIAAHMELPSEINITPHYFNATMPNAFATLGGNIIVLAGLIENVHSENGLAMVLAHEIAHIKHRDPIVALSGGATVGLIFSIIIGGADGGSLIPSTLALTQMRFSREQEANADAEAIKTIKKMYGFTNGGDELFNVMIEKYLPEEEQSEFFQTHPDTRKRVKLIRETFDDHEHQLTPLVLPNCQ